MILQSDPEWATARLGRVTASRITDIIAKTKTGPSASRANYAAELVAERLTGKSAESGFINGAMQWGLDTEPHARAAYEFITDASVSPAAFVIHPKIEWAGATPDGFIGEDGLVEFKCPNTSTHIDTLLQGQAPTKYIPQVQWQMACTGRRWTDFVSFDPRLPEQMRLFVRRIERDEDMVQALERQVEEFLGEVEDTLHRLRRAFAEAA